MADTAILMPVKALLVFGARPNFMKIAPVYRAMRQAAGFEPVLLHTGQHFDKEMSGDFIEALGLPAPDVHLDVGSGSQAWQIAEIIHRLEPVLLERQPDVTVVVGDVSSTLAAALVSHTLGIPVAHVEAGLRSRDWTMPEERNRVLTDRLSRFLFTPSADADQNLLTEGIDRERIFQVGNVMIDSLEWVLPRIAMEQTSQAFGVAGEPYGLVTLHRPSNVDDIGALKAFVHVLTRISQEVPLLFPVHPRTKRQLARAEITLIDSRVRTLPPLGYAEFIGLMAGAAFVLTDSGGIQEEASVLGVPCLTLRENTERPITLTMGTNELVGQDSERIEAAVRRVLAAPRPSSTRPPLWDGRTAGRIVQVLASLHH